MKFRHRYERCLALVRRLELPRPFDITTVCERLARDRGRAIQLVPLELPPGGLSGAWVATNRADYVLYQSKTSRLHQDHIVLHEIGHMLCGHENDQTGEEAISSVLPHLDPKMVRQVLCRNHYTSSEEEEAEIVASIVLDQVTRSPVERPGNGRTTSVMRRIERSLNDSRSERA